MIEFNGWVKLALSTDGEGEDELYTAVQRLMPMVHQLRGARTFPFIDWRNGAGYLHLAGNANHLGADWADARQLLDVVAHQFPGAYGVVYLRDDEDTQGNENRFMVYVLRRGSVAQVPDALLSPCNPLIGD